MKLIKTGLIALSLAFFACSSDDSPSSAGNDDNGAKSSSSVSKEEKPSASKDVSSSASKDDKNSSAKYDCTTSDGVVVVYPEGGEKFKLGDSVTVIYGADPGLAGPFFYFKYRANEDDIGMDLTDEAAGEENPDGKTCYKQTVYLDPDLLDASEEAFINVIPYVKTQKNGKSGKFTVTE